MSDSSFHVGKKNYFTHLQVPPVDERPFFPCQRNENLTKDNRPLHKLLKLWRVFQVKEPFGSNVYTKTRFVLGTLITFRH